jgi:hypothetical protein
MKKAIVIIILTGALIAAKLVSKPRTLEQFDLSEQASIALDL